MVIAQLFVRVWKPPGWKGERMSGGVEGEELTLQGIVVPTQWSPDGKVTRVAILTRDESEYEVAPRAAARQLMNHLRREVLAQAVPTRGLGLEKRVQVNSFAVLEWTDTTDDIISTLKLGGA